MSKSVAIRLDETLLERAKAAAVDAGESFTQYVSVALEMRLEPPVIGKVEQASIPPYVRGPGITKASNVPPPEPKATKEAAAPIIQEARRSLERSEVETHFKT